VVMLKIVLSLTAIAILVLLSEFLGHKKFIKTEIKRKFFHVGAGSFIAFWPWFMSFHTIEVLGIFMAVVVLINDLLRVFDFDEGLGRRTYGVFFLALAISVTAFLAQSKIEFMIAILCVSIADAFAAVAGTFYGSRWRYYVAGQEKTVIGTMVFWLAALIVIATSLFFSHSYPNDYLWLIVVLPPILTVTESLGVFGIDNLSIPLVTVLILNQF